MRGLLKVTLAVVTVLFSAFLIERSCREDRGRPDPNQHGGVAVVTQPPLFNGAPNTKSMAHIAQATPRVESDARVATVAPSKRAKAREENVAVAPAQTPVTKQAKGEDDIQRTARTATPRAARRTVARTKTVRKEQQWRVAARKKRTEPN